MDLHSFITLSEQELEEVGVTIVEDRKALLLLIKSLKTSSSTKATPTTKSTPVSLNAMLSTGITLFPSSHSKLMLLLLQV